MNWLEDRKLSAPILEENVHYYRNLIPLIGQLSIYEDQKSLSWRKDCGDIEFLKKYLKNIFSEQEFFEKYSECYNNENIMYLDLNRKCFVEQSSMSEYVNTFDYLTPNKTIEDLIKMYEETKELIIFNPYYSRHIFNETDILFAYNKPFEIIKFIIEF